MICRALLLSFLSFFQLFVAGRNVTVGDQDIYWPTSGVAHLWTPVFSNTCGSPAHFAYASGMTVSYTFTGTAVYLTILRSSVTGIYTVMIDDEAATTIDGNAPQGICQTQFGRTGLAFSPHRIVVTLSRVSPQAAPTATTPYLEIDQIIYTVPDDPAPVPSSAPQLPSPTPGAPTSTTQPLASSTSVTSVSTSVIIIRTTSSLSGTSSQASSPSTASPSAGSSASSPTVLPASTRSSTLQTPVIAGLAVGLAVTTLFSVFIVFFIRQRRRNNASLQATGHAIAPFYGTEMSAGTQTPSMAQQFSIASQSVTMTDPDEPPPPAYGVLAGTKPARRGR